MTCTCKPCPDCHGLGVIWYSWNGEFVGRRNDDMGHYESCEECNGTGIDLCEECEADEADEEDEEENENEVPFNENDVPF